LAPKNRQFGDLAPANLWREDTLTPYALWLLLLWRFFANTAQYIFVCFLYYIIITHFFVKHILGRQACVHQKRKISWNCVIKFHEKKLLLDTTLLLRKKNIFWKIPNGKKILHGRTTWQSRLKFEKWPKKKIQPTFCGLFFIFD